jgi:hypothetical protein
MITWRERLEKAVKVWDENSFLPNDLRMDRVFKEAGVRDLVVENQEIADERDRLAKALEQGIGDE